MDRRKRVSSTSVEDRYKVLLDVGRILTATLKPEALYRTIFEQTKRVLDLAGFIVATYDDAGDAATVVFHAEADALRPTGARFSSADAAAIRQRCPILTTNPAEAIPPGLKAENGFACISAPMVHDDDMLGVISAYTFHADGYDENDLELLSAIADHAAVAVANSAFVEERERRRREAELLEEIGRALTASLDLPRVLERVAAAALDLTASDSAAVCLLRNDDQFEIAMTAGSIAPERGLVFAMPALRELAENKSTLIVENSDGGSDISEYLRSLTRAASTMTVILRAGDALVGALSLGQRVPRSYTSDDMRLLERLSYHASIAVGNARLHEQILGLSMTDPLTGLPNRRNMEMFFNKEFAAAKRGRRLTVVIFDLDNFKEYNDRAGHPAGDEALRAFARVLTHQTRAMNLAARYGGDEFISILADTDRRGGITHAARIARAVALDPLLTGANLRASAGIATYNARMVEPADLIRAADRDLYARKHGREGQALR